MSLINQMLKDLEKRERPANEHASLSLPNIKKKTVGKTKLYLIIPLLTVLIAGIIIIAFKKKIPTIKLTLVHPTVQKVTPAKNNISSPTWAHPVHVNSITLKSKDDITEVAFLLDHSALYRLASNTDKNLLILTFPYGSFKADPPVLNYLNTALQSITPINAKDELQIKLNLKPGTIIKSVNLIGEEKNPKVVVTLFYHEPQPQPTTDKTRIVKTPALETIIHDQYQLALLSVDKGEELQAINQLHTILKTAPDYNDARVSLSALLLSSGKNAEAQKILDRGLIITPNYLPFIELKARVLTAQGKLKEALALLQTRIQDASDNPDYLSFLAALYERNDDHLLAIKIYKQLISNDSQNGNWWFGLGLSLEKLGQSRQAYNAYQRAITEGQLNTDAALYLQNRLQKMQELADDTK